MEIYFVSEKAGEQVFTAVDYPEITDIFKKQSGEGLDT